LLQTTIISTVLLSLLIFLVPKRYFLLPFILAACFLPADQRVIIFTLDFTPLRILIVAGVLRIFLRGEEEIIKWNKFDKLLLGWAICGAIVYIIQWGDMRAFIYKCGRLFDIIGLYWIFRQSIRSWSDIKFIVTVFAFCAILMVPWVIIEKTTTRNPFLFFGKVFTAFREGNFRCQAAFPHSIIFGVFWANLIPIFIASVIAGHRKFLYSIAVLAGIFMVWTSASSTPYGTLIANLSLLILFPFRRYGKLIALGIFGQLVALHIVMKAPVWHLLSRIKFVSGSTGYHRYKLINETIDHFSEWALRGTRSTAHWGYGLSDITNQYCAEGVTGGFITLVFFVIVLITAVRTVGRYSLQNIPREKQWLAWGICVSILGHCISFIGVSYFGQIHMLLYLTFATIGMIYGNLYARSPILTQQILTYEAKLLSSVTMSS
jgi:hypothetical protein